MIANLSIRAKLSLIYVAFLLPIAFLVYSVVSDRNVSIGFAGKELLGSAYLASLRDTQLGLQRYRLDGDQAPLKSAFAGVAARQNDSGAELDVGAAFQDLDRSIGTILSATSPDAKTSILDAALPKLRALIARVGDASNLILDPDLDSFYAMDIVVVKLPGLLDRIGEIAAATSAVVGRVNLSAEDKSAFLISRGGLNSSIDDLASDLAAGYRGNTDGSLKAALDAPYANLTVALEALTKATAGALEQHDGAAALAIIQAQATATNALGRFWQAVQVELDRLLAARIARFHRELVMTLTMAAATTVLALVLMVFAIRQIVRPIVALTGDMTLLADGDRSVSIHATDRRDEIGEMARRIERFKEALMRSDRTAAERNAEVARRTARQHEMADLTRDFMAQIDDISRAVTERAADVRNRARGFTETADATSSQSRTVAEAAQDASAGVETVAAAAEELSASIGEVRRQVAAASAVSARAVEQAGETNDTVHGLADAASRIGEVVALINVIAAQTHLLALNATIEAARAGEAGRGFAVVAAEVKNLAAQTADATGEIQAQIAAIQSETGRAVAAIGAISETIGSISDINRVVAEAVDQQEAATGEIARNIQQAAMGTLQVSNTIGSVTSAASDTRGSAETMLGSAEEMARQADVLKSRVDHFIAHIQPV